MLRRLFNVLSAVGNTEVIARIAQIDAALLVRHPLLNYDRNVKLQS